MSSIKKRTNVKLAKLFYKYADEISPNVEVKEETKKPVQNEEAVYPPYNFSWLIENKIAGMGCPQTAANLNYLADVGINHLITLSAEKIPPILECSRKLKWTEIRIKESAAPTLRQIIKFIEICERAEINGEIIGVHCRHGRGRTGAMLACYLVKFKNMAPERAVLTVRVQRPGSCETFDQQKIVCHYHDCLKGTITRTDYRLVDDKSYFDLSMKDKYPDEEKQAKEESDIIETLTKKIDPKKLEELIRKEELEERRTRTKAMIIHHKIYF
ncbi:dual specificity protein phosphatase 23 [Bicyclus anynana]|uniref:Dual specificity protein phosphatase 23 n=1 Tax=Bicyclus anynana TaxID=110368 RepID=A0ABM3LN22_BICAN|nr:dual specificity protein phosphatase 23 [Bicyclus anynana]XP_052740478.1 dual specificity protein phosphatase 23 [Bicyclus anynana]